MNSFRGREVGKRESMDVGEQVPLACGAESLGTPQAAKKMTINTDPITSSCLRFQGHHSSNLLHHMGLLDQG